jgi:hypothetical protein
VVRLNHSTEFSIQHWRLSLHFKFVLQFRSSVISIHNNLAYVADRPQTDYSTYAKRIFRYCLNSTKKCSTKICDSQAYLRKIQPNLHKTTNVLFHASRKQFQNVCWNSIRDTSHFQPSGFTI